MLDDLLCGSYTALLYAFKHTESAIKGQCHEIFNFWFFFMNQFPPSTWVYHLRRAFQIFCEISRKYSRLKVHHRCRWHQWQMEKIFKQKNLNYFICTPLGSSVNIYINFCFQVHFKVSAAWYCSLYLPPVSTTPVANLPPVLLIQVAICYQHHWHWRQICQRCRWHRWCTLTCEYFRKNLKWP